MSLVRGAVSYTHLTAAASDVPTVALDAGLTDQEVALITEADEGYILKFKSVELWQTLKAKLTK